MTTERVTETPITDFVRAFLKENRGFISENDLINAIALLAGNGEEHHPPGGCTETNNNADVLCGARSLVEHAMLKFHASS